MRLNRGTALAWQMAALSRRKKLPTLKSLLKTDAPTRKMTPQAMASALAMSGLKSRPLSDAARAALRVKH